MEDKGICGEVCAHPCVGPQVHTVKQMQRVSENTLTHVCVFPRPEKPQFSLRADMRGGPGLLCECENGVNGVNGG